MTIIKDCIYRFIKLPGLCREFSDTPEFQRLRRIKQLGVAHYTFPSAVHTRFEHCLGVMHLAGLAVDSISKNANIQVSERTRELIMLAGLLHDIGHMAFSHMFDDVAGRVEGLADEHESRSVVLLHKMNDRLGILGEEELAQVSAMIEGAVREKDAAWKYQIVCNQMCGVDVDKMDYLQRDAYHTGIPGYQSDYIIMHMTIDADTNLAFCEKTRTELRNLFETRKRMYSTVYFHKTTTKLDALYKGMIRDSIDRLDSTRIVAYFDDDFQAESYLRNSYPILFGLLDRRDISGALSRGGYQRDKDKEASYVSGCNNLDQVMNRISFV